MLPAAAPLNESWLKRVLQASGFDARGAIARERSASVGTTSRRRLALRLADGSELSLFIKQPSSSLRARLITTAPGLLQTEARFYSELASELRRLVEIPHCYASGALASPATLVLEDLEPSPPESQPTSRVGRVGDALTPCEAAALVDALARLHGGTWRSAGARWPWLNAPVRLAEDRLGSLLAPILIQRGFAKAPEISQSLRRELGRYARRRRRIMAHFHKQALTLVHHDVHAGNVFWRHGAPGLLDWQLVRVGDGAGDLAYLLATSLETPLRRALQGPLVRRYRDGLAASGVPQADLLQLETRVAEQMCYALEAMLVTLAIGGLMPEAENRQLLERSIAAVEENESFPRLWRALARPRA